MKRLLLTIAAVTAIAGPMAAVANEAAAQDRGQWDHRGDRGHDRGDRHDGRRDDGRRDGGRWDDRGRHGGWDRGNRWDRHDRWDHRDRWDSGRHNGYYYNNRWNYGAPPSYYYGRPGYRPGYSAWRRGGYLPPYYRGGGYVIRDYGYYRLRPPPRGYYWYRAGNDYVLAAISTGLIFDIINN